MAGRKERCRSFVLILWYFLWLRGHRRTRRGEGPRTQPPTSGQGSEGRGFSAATSETVGADDLGPRDGAQGTPGIPVNRTLDESHAAVTHQGIHTARVIAARRDRREGW